MASHPIHPPSCKVAAFHTGFFCKGGETIETFTHRGVRHA